MRLTAIVERSVEVVLPNEALLRQVPVADAVVALFAIGRVLVACFENAGGSVMQLIGESSVAIPMMFRLVTPRPFLPSTTQVEHIALCVFLREAVVAEAIRNADFIASFVEFPGVVNGCLEEVLRQFVAVVAVGNVADGG